MKKLYLWMVMCMVLTSVVSALDLCTDSMEVSQNCSMVTPVLGCNNYTLYDVNGTVIIQENLTVFNGQMYYFNLSQPIGDYIVRLCDDSVKQVRIRAESDKMFLIAIVLLPLIVGFILLYWGNQLGEDSFLRLVFQLFFIPLVWVSIHFGVIAIGFFYPSMSSLVTELSKFTYYLGWILLLVGLFLLYRVGKNIYDMIQEKKIKREEDLYG